MNSERIERAAELLERHEYEPEAGLLLDAYYNNDTE